MPKYGQMRRYLLEALKEEGLIEEGERLTTEVAMRLKKPFTYDAHFLNDSFFVCTMELPSDEIMELLINGDEKEAPKKKKKSQKSSRTKKLTKRRKVIEQLCKSLKEEHPGVVLAVIPEAKFLAPFNPQKTSKGYSTLASCSTLLLFIADNEEGRKLANTLSKKTK